MSVYKRVIPNENSNTNLYCAKSDNKNLSNTLRPQPPEDPRIPSSLSYSLRSWSRMV